MGRCWMRCTAVSLTIRQLRLLNGPQNNVVLDQQGSSACGSSTKWGRLSASRLVACPAALKSSSARQVLSLFLRESTHD